MALQALFRSPLGALTACLLAVLGAACSPASAPRALPDQAQALGESGLWVSAPDLRLMPAMAMGAAYLTVHNRSERDDRLLAVRLADAPDAEASLHETTVVDGVSRMRPRGDGFPVAAGADLTLAPGGAHIMLSGSLAAAEGEDSLRLVLRFEHAGEHIVALPLAGAVP